MFLPLFPRLQYVDDQLFPGDRTFTIPPVLSARVYPVLRRRPELWP